LPILHAAEDPLPNRGSQTTGSTIAEGLHARRRRGPPPDVNVDPETAEALKQVEISFKKLESARVGLVQQVTHGGGRVQIVLPAPGAEEIGEMSRHMTDALNRLPPHLREQARPEFQKLYDDYANYPMAFKILEAVIATIGKEKNMVIISMTNSADREGGKRGSGREYMIDSKHPIDTVRFGNLLPSRD
jgi:hypothetical protein